MPLTPQTECWVVTDGKIGMENQCLGLAAALGLAPAVKRVKLRLPWRLFAPFLKVGLKHAFCSNSDALAPPFPDLVISTGRRAVPAALFIKQASGGKSFLVQLQDPVIAPDHFDLVVAPEHDGLKGPNVIATKGALHRVTPLILENEGKLFLPTAMNLPKPRIAILIGGSNSAYSLGPEVMAPLAQGWVQLARSIGGSLLATPSRRTGLQNTEIVREAFKQVPAYLWDGKGANPYFGLLAVADFILVTADSVNMVTEACRTGKPVYVIDLPGGSPKFRSFHAAMERDGYTRRFAGTLTSYSYPPLDDMGLVTSRITEAFLQR